MCDRESTLGGRPEDPAADEDGGGPAEGLVELEPKTYARMRRQTPEIRTNQLSYVCLHMTTQNPLLRRMVGLVFRFPFGFLGAGGRLPKARRGRVYCAVHHYHRCQSGIFLGFIPRGGAGGNGSWVFFF